MKIASKTTDAVFVSQTLEISTAAIERMNRTLNEPGTHPIVRETLAEMWAPHLARHGLVIAECLAGSCDDPRTGPRLYWGGEGATADGTALGAHIRDLANARAAKACGYPKHLDSEEYRAAFLAEYMPLIAAFDARA